MEASKESNTNVPVEDNQNAGVEVYSSNVAPDGAGGAKAGGSTGTEDKTTKAPERDATISKDSFESNPTANVKYLRK